jgi:hypothetical protein
MENILTLPSTSGFSGTSLTNGGSLGLVTTNLNSNAFSINNNTTKATMQTKVAVFKVERNEKSEIVKSRFVKELWIERKPTTSLDLLVAKELGPDFNPEEIVIREMQTFYL